jgi:type I restriction enzyme S subunit
MIAAEVQNIKASWLSDIPSHWNVIRLKTIVKGGTNGVWGSEPKKNKNDIVCVRVADIDEWQYGISQSDLTHRNISDTDQSGRLLNYGDLIIEKSGGGEISPVGRVVIFNFNEKAVTSNFMARLNVIGDINKEFLYYYFRFLYYRRLNHPAIKATTGIQNLDLYAYLQNPMPIPTPKEQSDIVEFINHSSGEITRFIQTKQRFIELLKEQRQGIVNNIVTKGTDKLSTTIDSGYDWLGRIPNHWKMIRVKNVFDLVTEQAPVGNKDVLLSIYSAIGVKPRKDMEQRGNKSTTTDGYWKVKQGDIIVNKLLTWMGAIGISEYDGVTSPAYDILRLKIDGNPFYYSELFRSSNIRGEFKKYSKGIMDVRLRLYFSEFGKIFIPVFSKDEQDKIVEHIKSETKTLDIAISKAEREIELIKEYREAMIAEAVTGKMNL